MTSEVPDESVVPVLPPAKRGPARAVVALVAVLLLGASIAFGVLYATQSSRVDSLTAEVSSKEKGLTDSEVKVRENGENLTKSQEALKTAQEANLKADADNAVHVPCRDLAKKLLKNKLDKDETAYQETLRALYATC